MSPTPTLVELQIELNARVAAGEEPSTARASIIAAIPYLGDPKEGELWCAHQEGRVTFDPAGVPGVDRVQLLHADGKRSTWPVLLWNSEYEAGRLWRVKA